VLDWLQKCVLASARITAQHQRVVNLVARMLAVVGEPANDVLGVVGID
jgi:hypothetical protein